MTPRHGERPPKGAPDARTSSLDPGPWAVNRAEAAGIACRMTNAEWAIVTARLPYRSQVARTRALLASGTVSNEAWFGTAYIPRAGDGS